MYSFNTNMTHTMKGQGNHCRFWLSCLGHLIFVSPKDFYIIGVPLFWLWTYPMKLIPEKRRGH
jgi:hypothetical protein